MRVMDGTAYFDRAVSYRCKMFMKLTTGVNAIKLFFPRTNKLNILLIEKLFSLVEHLWVRP
jgi:hypothetical protein